MVIDMKSTFRMIWFCFVLAILLFFCPDSAAGRVRDYIVGGQSVELVRHLLIYVGAAVAFISVIGRIAMWFFGKKDKTVISDDEALRLLLCLMAAIAFFCIILESRTKCDFSMFRSGSSLALAVIGSIVAVRAKRPRYVLYYLLVFFATAGILLG